MAFHSTANNYSGELTLNGDINDSVTSVTVSGDLTDISSILPVYLTVEGEILEVTAISGQILTVVRGVDNTTAASHLDTTAIRHYLVAANINELNAGALTSAQKDTLTDGSLADSLHIHSATNFSNLVVVAKGGGNYNSVQDAIDYVGTQSPADGDNWVIHVYPGTYSESIVLTDYIAIIGQSADDEVIITSSTGPVVTFPSNHAEIKGLHLKLTPTTIDQSVIYANGGVAHIHSCVLTAESSTPGVSANIIDVDGAYDLLFNYSTVNYIMNGSSVGTRMHCVLDMNGSGKYLVHDNQMNVTIGDADDDFMYLCHSTTSVERCFMTRNKAIMSMENAAYSGNATAINIEADNSLVSMTFNQLEITSNGNGTGTAVKVDSTSGTAVFEGAHNKVSVIGFATNYTSWVGVDDTVNSYLDVMSGADGPNILSSNVSFATSNADGFIAVTHGLQIGLANNYVLPATDGEVGQSLVTDGNHVVGWGGLPYGSSKSFATGFYYDCSSNGDAFDAGGSTQALGANYMFASRFIVGETATFDRIGAEVTVTGTSGRVGIYSDSSGRPDALVLDSGIVDFSSTGAKEVTISQELTAGIYWLVINVSASTTVRAFSNTEGRALDYVSSTSTTKSMVVSVAHTFGALPATFGTAVLNTAKPIRVFMRKS